MAGSPFSITVDASQAIKALGALSGPGMAAKLSAALREAALFAERAVASKAPVKTGVLRASIKAAQEGALAWRIASPVVYAPVVEGGSRPHVIRPRGGRFLAFEVGGARVYARQVRHPGTRGRFMFRDGAAALQSALPGILAKHVTGP